MKRENNKTPESRSKAIDKYYNDMSHIRASVLDDIMDIMEDLKRVDFTADENVEFVEESAVYAYFSAYDRHGDYDFDVQVESVLLDKVEGYSYSKLLEDCNPLELMSIYMILCEYLDWKDKQSNKNN